MTIAVDQDEALERLHKVAKAIRERARAGRPPAAPPRHWSEGSEEEADQPQGPHGEREGEPTQEAAGALSPRPKVLCGRPHHAGADDRDPGLPTGDFRS